MFDASRAFKTFFRGVHSLEGSGDDEYEPRQGVHAPKPVTLGKMEWASTEAFEVFARNWRVKKFTGSR
jgi:hypothetical protein